MHRFQNILIPVHADTPPNGVLHRASVLARQNEASVRLIAVVEDVPWYTRLVLPNAEELASSLVHDQTESLERLAEPLRREGLAVSTGVLRGHRAIEYVREVLRGGHDLLMKEAEPNDNVLFGSVDMYVLRTCPCPVWIVKPGHGDLPFSKVLATVDPAPPPDEADLLDIKEGLTPGGDDLDLKILELAGSLTDRDGSELHVLHVWSAPGEMLVRGNALLTRDQVENYVEDSRAEASKSLDRLLAKCPDLTGRRVGHLVKGDAVDEIANFAKSRGVDLIVMGTVARTGIPGFVIGNTAEAILQRVDCSVLAVKPRAFVSPVHVAG